MDAVRIDHLAPDGIFATYRNVLIWSWRGPATTLTVQRMRLQLLAHAKGHPEGGGVVTIIGRGVAIPPDEIRKAMVKARREASCYAMRGSAILYEGDGFRGSVVRGVVTGLMLLASDIYPQAVFGDIDLALVWVRTKLGPAAPPEGPLAAAVASVRAHPGFGGGA